MSILINVYLPQKVTGLVKSCTNLDAVFQHLKDRKLFKEFRSGVVNLENWADEPGLGIRIQGVVELLYSCLRCGPYGYNVNVLSGVI